MIAVEIASRDNTAEEIEGKVAAYIEEGVGEIWVIYPRTRTLTVSANQRMIRIADTYECESLELQVDVPALLAV